MTKSFITKEIGSKDFHIHRTALAIFALLTSFEVSDLTEDERDYVDYLIDIRSYPWYNGRERGICIIISNNGEQLNIAFGEIRNSDGIFVDVWETKSTFNPPTVADFSDEAYEQRNYFKYDEHYKVSQFVQKLIESKTKEFLATKKK